MNIAQALKQKNRLQNRLSELTNYLLTKNKKTEDDPIDYKLPEKDIEYLKTVKELIDIKARLARASMPIQEKIVEMGLAVEAKKKLSTLEVDEAFTSTYVGSEYKRVKNIYHIDHQKKEDMLKDLTNRINALQDEIDSFNAITSV